MFFSVIIFALKEYNSCKICFLDVFFLSGHCPAFLRAWCLLSFCLRASYER